jgi:tRNA A37 threonylcarbamoyladenosine synthetase subunit TsaC/SUA5/YrdC
MSEMDLPELDRAELRAVEVLRGGGAVVVTSPSPMTYGVVARNARAINRLKGRPVDQPVGISVHTEAAHDQLFRYLDVGTDTLAAIDFALAERISVLTPIRSDPTMPEWLAPAIQDGWVLFFDGSWGRLAFLWTSFPFLYGSSANRTGEAPAASAAEARAQFPAGTVIIDADHLRTPATAYGASTMIRVDRDGRLTLHRSGIQDQAAGGAGVFLDRLREFRSAIAVLDGSASTPMGKAYLSTAVTEDGEPKQLVPKTRIRLEFARVPNKNADGPRVYDVVRAHVEGDEGPGHPPARDPHAGEVPVALILLRLRVAALLSRQPQRANSRTGTRRFPGGIRSKSRTVSSIPQHDPTKDRHFPQDSFGKPTPNGLRRPVVA